MALAMGRRGEEMLLLTGGFVDRSVKVWVRRADQQAMALSATAKAADGGNQGANPNPNPNPDPNPDPDPNPNPNPDQGGPQGGSWVLEHNLLGHEDGVSAVELSRQRRHAYSGSNDGVVRIWG